MSLRANASSLSLASLGRSPASVAASPTHFSPDLPPIFRQRSARTPVARQQQQHHSGGGGGGGGLVVRVLRGPHVYIVLGLCALAFILLRSLRMRDSAIVGHDGVTPLLAHGALRSEGQQSQHADTSSSSILDRGFSYIAESFGTLAGRNASSNQDIVSSAAADQSSRDSTAEQEEAESSEEAPATIDHADRVNETPPDQGTEEDAHSEDASRCTSSAELAEATAALTKWVRRSHHTAVGWYGRVLHLHQLLPLHACTEDTRIRLRPSDFLVLVRVHASRAEQAAAIRRTWATRARASGASVVFYSDAPVAIAAGEGDSKQDEEATVIARGGPKVDASPVVGAMEDDLALWALQWALSYAPSSPSSSDGSEPKPPPSQWKWVLAVTDETWLNLDEALPELRFLNTRLPLIVGHQNAGRISLKANDFRTHPLLHAGVLLTRSAIEALTQPVGNAAAQGCVFDPAVRDPAAERWALQPSYDPSAPSQPPPTAKPGVTGRVDRLSGEEAPMDAGQVMARCAWLRGLPLLHSYLLWDGFDHATTRSWKVDGNALPLHSVITVARLGVYSQARGGRNSTAVGGDSMDSVHAVVEEGRTALPGRWSPSAHDKIASGQAAPPSPAPWAPPVTSDDDPRWPGGGAACTDADRDEAAAVLREWALKGHHPTARLYGTPLHLARYYGLHPCLTHTAAAAAGSSKSNSASNSQGSGEPPSDASHVAVVVMASLGKHRDRLEAAREAWMATAQARGMRLTVVTERDNATLGTIALPPHATDPSYAGAQNRSLYGLIHAVTSASPDARWYLLVDDDTWVNPDVIARLVRHAEWRVPVLFGHVMHGAMRWSAKWTTYASGGAGILLSRAAATILAASLFTPACPFSGLNDVTIGRCAWLVGIPPVHVNHFQPELDTASMDDWRLLGGTAEMGALAAVHRVFPAYTHTWIQRDLAAHGALEMEPEELRSGKAFDWRLPAVM